jgi:hypothetical protein
LRNAPLCASDVPNARAAALVFSGSLPVTRNTVRSPIAEASESTARSATGSASVGGKSASRLV